MQAIRTIYASQILLNQRTYPESAVYPECVAMFAVNIRGALEMHPVEGSVLG